MPSLSSEDFRTDFVADTIALPLDASKAFDALETLILF